MLNPAAREAYAAVAFEATKENSTTVAEESSPHERVQDESPPQVLQGIKAMLERWVLQVERIRKAAP